MKKRIKIFAAFDKDVEEDIVRFGDFLCGLNAQNTGIEFSIFKSEKELCESLEQPKEQIDTELETCEYFLLILGGKNDEFALDKLNRAIERYAKTHGNPDVHVFVNAANKNADKVINYFASEEYEHYVEQFKHHDTLKAKFLIWLSAKQKDFAYEVDKDIHGTPVIKVNGVPVSGLVDFDALLNNEDYKDSKKKLDRKRAERENLRKELHEAEGEERNDLWDDISALAKEIDELQDKIALMEKDTLALYQNYAKMTLASGYNARLKRALECIERGELDRARRVLDPDGSVSNLRAMVNENEILAARIETNKKIAEQEINILFAEIDRLKMDTENKNCFEEIEKCYANIEYFQEKLGLEMTVLFDYALFLGRQNKHNVAIEKYTQELARLRKLAETNPDAYLGRVALTLNNMASKQKDTHRYKEAEVNYTEALEIFQKLAETNPDAYLWGVALTLNNLTTLLLPNTYVKKSYKEAEKKYTEALEIYRKLAGTDPDVYLSGLAHTLNSLASLQKHSLRYKEAEVNLTEALEIYRKLAGTDSDAYLSGLACTLNNLADMQYYTSRKKEAEVNLTEALGIYRKLAETDPDAYLSSLARMLKNLADMQRHTNRYTEAKQNYTEELEIYRKLAKTNPDIYLSDLADTLNNMGVLQSCTGRYTEAEGSYAEALEINRKLAETDPDIYLSSVALTLNNLADIQRYTNRNKEAETNYTEALEIRRKLAETNPDVYLSRVAHTLNNLIEVKEILSKIDEAEKLKKELAEIKKDAKSETKVVTEDELELIMSNINAKDDESITSTHTKDEQNEIDRLIAAIIAGNAESVYKKPSYKIYDFKRPYILTKDNIDTLNIIHKELTEKLTDFFSNYLKCTTKIHLAAVDELTYNDFTTCVFSPSCLAIINLHPLKENAIIEISSAIYNVMLNIQIDGYERDILYNENELTESEKVVMGKLMICFFNAIHESWKKIIEITPELTTIETSLKDVKIESPDEVGVLAMFECKINDIEGIINIFYPYSFIKPIKNKITSSYYNLGVETMNKPIKSDADQTSIPVSVVIGEKNFPLQSIKDMEIGTILELDKSIGEDMDIYAGNVLAAHGAVVVINDKFGIKITEICPEVTPK